MEKIKVKHSSGEYFIYVGEDILNAALDEFFRGKKYDRVFAVSDSSRGTCRFHAVV